ncbi:MAG: ISKra4 family transposase, partial [Cyanobacteria bacterium J06573_2]
DNVKVKIQVVVESDNNETQVIQEIMLLERDSLKPENLGRAFSRSKKLLHNTQRNLVEQQVAEFSFKKCLLTK